MLALYAYHDQCVCVAAIYVDLWLFLYNTTDMNLHYDMRADKRY